MAIPAAWSTGSRGTPESRTTSSSARAGPSRSCSIASRAARSTRTTPTRAARSTSGSAEKQESVGLAITNASTWTMPRARSAGTTVREPASWAPPDPAPTSTTVSAVRTIVQPPCATCRRVVSVAPAGTGFGSAGGRAINTTAAIPATAHPRRTHGRDTTHAAEMAARANAHAHPWGPGIGCVAHGNPEANAAVSPSMNAPAAATAPHAPPAAGDASTSAIVPTPAIVVSAATGMVRTLSGTASIATDPPCAAAMGVLTDHATVDATTPETHASATMPVASCRDHRGWPGIRASAPRMRSCHRRAAPGARRRSAATTP